MAPILSLLGASIYFGLLSFEIKIVPFSAFDLKDHFDKAADLFLPVFVVSAVASLLSYLLAMEMMERAEAHNAQSNERHIFRRSVKVISTLLGFVILFVAPPIFRTLAFMGLMLVPFSFIMRRLIFYKSSTLSDRVLRERFRLYFMPYSTIFVAIIYLVLQYDLAIFGAKTRHLETDNRVIIDKIELGLIVIEEDEYRLVLEDGATTMIGPKVEYSSIPYACRWGLEFACRNTLQLKEQTEGE